MKTIKIIFLLIILITTSCNDDNIKNETQDNSINKNSINLIANQNDLSFNLYAPSNNINYETHIENNNISSKLTIVNSNNEIEHIINYNFNVNNEFWKLKQEEKVI